MISQSAAYLLSKSKSQYKPDLHTKYFDLDDTRDSAWSVGTRTTIQVELPPHSTALTSYTTSHRLNSP